MYAGVVEGRIPGSIAEIGFLGGAVLILLDYRRALLYVAGIGYTVVQIPRWSVINAGEYSMLGYVDKNIQVVFILLLAFLYWSERDPMTANRDETSA